MLFLLALWLRGACAECGCFEHGTAAKCLDENCFVRCLPLGHTLKAACECRSQSRGIVHQGGARRLSATPTNLTYFAPTLDDDDGASEEGRRRLNKVNAYAGAWLAPMSTVVARGRWDSTQQLESGSYIAYDAAETVWRTSDPSTFWAFHLSEFEHSQIARYPFDEAMERVRTMIAGEVADVCGAEGLSRGAPASSIYATTLGVVPFYGGALNANAGNAHSKQPRDLKLLGLLTTLCSLLRDVARRVVVATCVEVPGDKAAVEAYLDQAAATGALTRRRAVHVVDVTCELSRLLPFAAMRALVAKQFHTTQPPEYVMYTEADLVLRWRNGASAQQVANLLETFPFAMITPHRMHKRYGSNPACGHRCGLSLTGQNRCHANSTVNDYLQLRPS